MGGTRNNKKLPFGHDGMSHLSGQPDISVGHEGMTHLSGQPYCVMVPPSTIDENCSVVRSDHQ
jgi:hypothetical protein